MRFLHTSDWQLGMTRHFLSEEAQARFTQDRIDAIRGIGRLAEAEKAEFVVVAGDVFESNQVQRQTVARALEALAAIPVPVYLLPGNHDPLDAGSIYSSRIFKESKPAHVHVLDGQSIVTTHPGVEIHAAPWTSKRPVEDLVGTVCDELGQGPERLRILVGHGAIDSVVPDFGNPAVISHERVERAIGEGRLHYLALGDRHSKTDVGDTGRIWYAGAPEATDFVETDPGFVLVIDLEGPDSIEVREHSVGRWTFVDERFELTVQEDLDRLSAFLDQHDVKERTIVRLSLQGILGLAAHAAMERLLDDHGARYAALELSEQHTNLALLPEESDLDGMGLSGFAQTAYERLRELATEPGEEARAASNALALLYRLAGGARS